MTLHWHFIRQHRKSYNFLSVVACPAPPPRSQLPTSSNKNPSDEDTQVASVIVIAVIAVLAVTLFISAMVCWKFKPWAYCVHKYKRKYQPNSDSEATGSSADELELIDVPELSQNFDVDVTKLVLHKQGMYMYSWFQLALGKQICSQIHLYLLTYRCWVLQRNDRWGLVSAVPFRMLTLVDVVR